MLCKEGQHSMITFESLPRMRNEGGGALRRFCEWRCPKEAFQSLATNP